MNAWRILLWELRRRFLVARLRRRGALAYDVVKALNEDALAHPHPISH